MTDILLEFGHKCRLSRDDNMWKSSKDKRCDIQDKIKSTKSKRDRRARKFSWSAFRRPSVVSLYNEVYKQAKQENSAPDVVAARNSSKAKKKEGVGFMLYGDSIDDQVDQRIDFILGLSDGYDSGNYSKDERIIFIDDQRGHDELNRVVDSFPVAMIKARVLRQDC